MAILHTVQDPKAIFDAEFIVVDNDAFPAYVPSCIPSVDAEALYQAYETEKANFTPETEVLSHYYASVRTLDNRYYVALFNAIKKRISAAFRSIRKSRRHLPKPNLPCPMTSPHWYWRISS